MSEVTCPRCRTRQQLEDPSGYTCAGCGTAWMFVTCDNCGERFHMRPGTTAWTCPACGREHGSATMDDLGPDDADALPADQPRHAAPPKTEPSSGTKRPPTRGKLATLAVLGIAAVLVVSFALSSLGAEQAPGQPSTTLSPTVSPTPAGAIEALCLHIRDLQTPRVDSLTRLAATLEQDAAAVAGDGKQNLAEAIERLKVAVEAFRDALAAQGDTTAANAQVGAAISQLPCGAGG